jgi:hypothetical protein
MLITESSLDPNAEILFHNKIIHPKVGLIAKGDFSAKTRVNFQLLHRPVRFIAKLAAIPEFK